MCCLKLLVKISNVFLIIFPLKCVLALTQDGLKVLLKLVQLVLCSVQVLFDSQLQAPCPFPITVIVHSIEALLTLGVCQLGRHKSPRVVHRLPSEI